MTLFSARDDVITLALEYVVAERSEPHANYDAQLEYTADMLDQAIITCAQFLGGACTFGEEDVIE